MVYLPSFQNGVILYSTNITFDFITIYVEIIVKYREKSLCRRNSTFRHKLELFQEYTTSKMLKFGLEIDLRMVQNFILQFLKFCYFHDISEGRNITIIVTPLNLSPYQISAPLDCRVL